MPAVSAARAGQITEQARRPPGRRKAVKITVQVLQPVSALWQPEMETWPTSRGQLRRIEAPGAGSCMCTLPVILPKADDGPLAALQAGHFTPEQMAPPWVVDGVDLVPRRPRTGGSRRMYGSLCVRK